MVVFSSLTHLHARRKAGAECGRARVTGRVVTVCVCARAWVNLYSSSSFSFVAARAETHTFMMMMMTMGPVVSYLSSSELVAGFQRACGLFPAPRASHERLCPGSTRIHGRANGTSPCVDGRHAANGRKSDVSTDHQIRRKIEPNTFYINISNV